MKRELISIAAICLAIQPVYAQEQTLKEAVQAERIGRQEAADRAYQAEVAAEEARWEAKEAEETAREAQEAEQALIEEEYWDSLELLAQVVEAEAGNQDMVGKRLVADVVLNRVESPYYPDTIEEVIRDEGQFTSYSNGALAAAGWHMQQEDYDAVLAEITGGRLDYEIFFFTAGNFNPSGEAAYQHGDHYFSYLPEEFR